jgi:hypothetical protein
MLYLEIIAVFFSEPHKTHNYTVWAERVTIMTVRIVPKSVYYHRRFVSLSVYLSVHLNAESGSPLDEFRRNFFGNFLKTSRCSLNLVNIGTLHGDRSTLYCCHRLVIAVTGLDGGEVQLGCYDSLSGTNIMRTQHNVSLYVLCLSYPVSDL